MKTSAPTIPAILLKRVTLIFAIVVLALQAAVLPAYTAQAFNDPEQKDAFDLGILYFNTKEDEFCAQGAAGAGGPANINVDKGFSLGTDAKERRINLAKALMRDYPGLQPHQAAGIIGNFMQESGGPHLPPDVNQGGRPGPPAFKGGYGWAQWTGGRQRTFIDFAVVNGFMASRSVNATDAANYAYLKHELNTGYKSTITELTKQPTPTAAAVSFHATFEKSADNASQIGERGTSAEQVFRELNGEGGGGGGPAAGGGADGCPAAGGGGAGIVGANSFPLKTTKGAIDAQNKGMFANGTASKGGHPYTAYDILAPPGVPVLAFLGGTVTSVSQDRCPGRMISVFNPESNLTISYLHLSFGGHALKDEVVTAGQQIGTVGPASNGCGVAHLHIDAAQGNSRPGCSRLNCPPANASKFVDIGPQLSKTYDALPQ